MIIIPAPQDVAFNLFSIPIYWYGIIMAFAIFVAISVSNYLFNKLNKNMRKDIIIEYAPLLIIFGILSARIYFCLLNSHYYFSHPLQILDIRQGGLSIHGAIIGGILTLYFISKKVKLSFLNILDIISTSVALGQSIGRWGNYFNSEAYGLPVLSQNWGLFIPQTKRAAQYADFNLFHPTFLYESILDFCAFIILLFTLKYCHKKYQGLTFFTYLTLYSVIRFFVEKIRIDSALNVGIFPIAEVVSCVVFFIGLVGIIVVILKNNTTKTKD